jgi:hypothetical protein
LTYWLRIQLIKLDKLRPSLFAWSRSEASKSSGALKVMGFAGFLPVAPFMH